MTFKVDLSLVAYCAMEFKEKIKKTSPASSPGPTSTGHANPAGLKEKLKKMFRVRNVTLFCLISLFLWWGSNSVVKYWSQPLSTDISFRYGDSELGIQFPLITLCQGYIFLKNPIFKECHDGSWDFLNTVVSCMKRNKTIKVTNPSQIYLEFIKDTHQLN